MSNERGLTHTALLYREPAALPGLIHAAIAEGLDGDDAVLVALPAAALAAVQKDWPQGPSREGRLEWLDTSAAGRGPGYLLPGVLHAFAGHHRGTRVRMIGTAWSRDGTDLEYPACMQHEAAVNAVLADRDALILCPYRSDAPTAVLRDVRRSHGFLRTAGRTEASPAYAPDQAALFQEFNLALPAPPATAVTVAVARQQLAAARTRVAQAATAAGLSPGRVTDAVVAANELATNAVQHGGGSGRMQLWTEDTRLVCQLIDTGRFDNWLAGRVPPAPTDLTGGRGLIMVHQLCDLVRTYTDAHGTQVRMYVSG